MSATYLPAGLPQPAPAANGLDAPFWSAARDESLVAQRCRGCRRWQWGPEWICHRCHGFDLDFEPVPGPARIYSYERVWHPVHPALAQHGTYLVVLVEFPEADGIRMVGNLMGDPHRRVTIGAGVAPVFEHHDDGDPPFTLIQWEVSS